MARPKSKNPTEAVRVYSTLVKMARMIGAFEEKDVSDVLSEVLDVPLRKRYAEFLKKLTEEKKQ